MLFAPSQSPQLSHIIRLAVQCSESGATTCRPAKSRINLRKIFESEEKYLSRDLSINCSRTRTRHRTAVRMLPASLAIPLILLEHRVTEQPGCHIYYLRSHENTRTKLPILYLQSVTLCIICNESHSYSVDYTVACLWNIGKREKDEINLKWGKYLILWWKYLVEGI